MAVLPPSLLGGLSSDPASTTYRFCVSTGKLKKIKNKNFSALKLYRFPSAEGTTVSLMGKEKVFCVWEFAELLL